MTDSDKVSAQVTRVCDGFVIRYKASDADGGRGLVLVQRESPVEPFVVWRWATEDTAGNPIATETGAILYLGDYHDTYEAAVKDFETRAPTR